MDMNFAVFQEPRGVMRIIQFIFSICAFATVCDYDGYVKFHCREEFKFEFDYPFDLELKKDLNLSQAANQSCLGSVFIAADFSSDSKFFVATGVLAFLYCIAAVILYIKFDELYRNVNHVPLGDFLLSIFMAVLWLSSSASWANALVGMKDITDPTNINIKLKNCILPNPPNPPCAISVSSFSSLNISVMLGFLNFFLWAADLWFLYKETVWFQNARNPPPSES